MNDTNTNTLAPIACDCCGSTVEDPALTGTLCDRCSALGGELAIEEPNPVKS